MKKAYFWAIIMAVLLFVGANQGCNFQRQPQAPQKGTLKIAVTGLPQYDGLVIQIQGEGGFAETTTEPEYSREVEGGIYKVRASAVTVSDSLYAPDSFEFLAAVEPGMTTEVVFSYSARGAYKATPASGTVFLERGAVKSIDGNTVVLKKSSVDSQGLSGGRVLVYPGDLRLPEGFIRRVLSVTTTNDGVVVETEQAALEEGFQELDIQLTKPLTEWEFASDAVRFVNGRATMGKLLALYGAKTISEESLRRLPIVSPWRSGDIRKLGEPWGISYQFSESIELNDGQLILDMAGEAGTTVDLDLQIAQHKLQSLDYSIEVSTTKRVELFLATAIEGWSGKKELPPISFGVWPIGVVTISPKVVLGVKASIEPTGRSILTENLSLIKYQSTTTSQGTLSYRRSEGTTLTTTPPSTNARVQVLANAEELSPTETGVQIDASLMLTAKLMLKFYEVIGPYFGIAIGPEGSIDLVCANDPWWALSLRGDALAGIKIGLGDFAVDISSSGPILDKPLAKAEDVFTISKTNFNVEAGDSAQFTLASTSLYCALLPLNLTLEEAPSGIAISPSKMGRGGGDAALNTDPELDAGNYRPILQVKSINARGIPVIRKFALNVDVSAPMKPDWTISPQQLTFSGTVGGPAPESKSFVLGNEGSTAGSFTLSSTATWLHASSPTQTLAPGETTSVAVSVDACTTGDEGTATAQIDVAGGGSSATVAVERVCTTAPAPHWSATPQQLSFSATIGSSAPASKNFSLGNDGTASGSFVLNTTAAWLHASSPTQTLAPGETTSVTVSVDACTASDEGAATAQVNVEGGGSSTAVAVERVCTTAPAPKIRIEPAALSFSNFGQMTQNFTVFNDGDADLAVNGITADVSWATVAGQPSSTSIPPGGSRVFESSASCTYLSTAQSPYQGYLTIATNDPDAPNSKLPMELICQPGSYAVEAKNINGSVLNGSYKSIAYWPNWQVAASVNSASNIVLFDTQLVGGENYFFEVYHTPMASDVVSWTTPLEEYWGTFQDRVPTGVSEPPKPFTRRTPVFSGSASAPATVSVGENWRVEQPVTNNQDGYSVRMVLKVRYLGGSSYCQPCEVVGPASASSTVSAVFKPEKPGSYEAIATLEAYVGGGWKTVDQYGTSTITLEARAPEIRVSPTQVSLSNLTDSSLVGSIVVYNDGQEDLLITNITDNRSWLRITNGSTRSIAPGSSYTYQIQATCDHQSPGQYSGAVYIYNNDPDENPVVVAAALECLAGVFGVDVRNVGGSVLGGDYHGVAYWSDDYSFAASVSSSTNNLSFSGKLTGGYDYVFEFYHKPSPGSLPYWIPQWMDVKYEYWGNRQFYVSSSMSSTEQFTRSQPYMLNFANTPTTSVAVGSAWEIRLNTSANSVGGTVRLHMYFRNRDGISSCNPSNCEAVGPSTNAGNVVRASFTPNSPGTYDAFAILEAYVGGKWTPVDQWGSGQVVSFTAQ